MVTKPSTYIPSALPGLILAKNHMVTKLPPNTTYGVMKSYSSKKSYGNKTIISIMK